MSLEVKKDLVRVPEYQKSWYAIFCQKQVELANINIYNDGEMWYSMFESNLFGISDRFPVWNHESLGLVAEYNLGYQHSDVRTNIFREVLGEVLLCSIRLGYREFAHNLQFILEEFDKSVQSSEGFSEPAFVAPKAEATFPREEFDAKVEKYLEILEKIGSDKDFTYYKCEYNCVIKGRTNIIVAVLEDKDGVCEVCGQKKCNK